MYVVDSSKLHTKAVKITFLTVFPTLDGCNFGSISNYVLCTFAIGMEKCTTLKNPISSVCVGPTVAFSPAGLRVAPSVNVGH